MDLCTIVEFYLYGPQCFVIIHAKSNIFVSTFYLPVADLTCGVMYWMLGTDDVYVYLGDTNPVISYCGFSDSFAMKLPVLRSIGFALIRAYKSAIQQQMSNMFKNTTVLWPVTDHAIGWCYTTAHFEQLCHKNVRLYKTVNWGILTPNKDLNILICRTPSCVIIYIIQELKLSKCSIFQLHLDCTAVIQDDVCPTSINNNSHIPINWIWRNF